MTTTGLVMYHNPRCSKSRQTLALLEENGAEPHIVKYLEDVPSEGDIKAIAKRLGLESVREMMRTNEAIYKELGLKAESNEDKLVAAMHANPKLIERPIVVHGDKAAIGRPPENVLKVL